MGPKRYENTRPPCGRIDNTRHINEPIKNAPDFFEADQRNVDLTHSIEHYC